MSVLQTETNRYIQLNLSYKSYFRIEAHHDETGEGT